MQQRARDPLLHIPPSNVDDDGQKGIKKSRPPVGWRPASQGTVGSAPRGLSGGPVIAKRTQRKPRLWLRLKLALNAVGTISS